MSRQLTERGFEVTAATSGAEALARAADAPFDAIVLDHSLGDANGVGLLEPLRALDPAITIVMVSGTIDVIETVRALRGGAEDVIPKPVNIPLLEAALERGMSRTELLRSRRLLDAQVTDPYGVLDASPAMQRTIRLVQQSAARAVPLLFYGEPGTGKRALAELAHQLSPHAAQPFVSVALGAVDDTAMARAIDHALAQLREASVERRMAGTVFFDDLRTLGPLAQERIRPLLDPRIAETIGMPPLDIRVMSGTTLDPHRLMEEAGVAAPLLQRLTLIPIAVPALHERGADVVAAMAQRVLSRLRLESGEGPAVLTDRARDWLASLHWPGNVPQLRRVLESAFVLAVGAPAVDSTHLEAPLAALGLHAGATGLTATDWTLDAMERRHIRTVLAMTGNHRSRAAQLLGITRTTLYKKIAEYELDGMGA